MVTDVLETVKKYLNINHSQFHVLKESFQLYYLLHMVNHLEILDLDSAKDGAMLHLLKVLLKLPV
jgi:hypothetical protein